MVSKRDKLNKQTADVASAKDNEDIYYLEKQLAPFLKYNPSAKVQRRGKLPHVFNPWNDEAISFSLKSKQIPRLIEALNNLVLPPRFTAIYHLDSNMMEYIFTVLETDDPYLKRKFKFILGRKTYFCEFARASDELLIVSKLLRRTGKATGTDYRNLLLLREYVQSTSKKHVSFDEIFVGMEPVSFYVSGFKRFNEDEILEVSKHLNFYMQYYDRESPVIVIHSPETEVLEKATQLKISETTFPAVISTPKKDPFLLDLALTANSVTTRLQFLYYYQILEYAAFYYTDTKTKAELLRIINEPDIHSYPEEYIPRIMEAVNIAIRQDEESKIQNVVRAMCSPEAVWIDIESNLSYFSAKQQFDGGFALEFFVPENISKDSFCGMWHPKTIDTLRMLRNALVHGREKRFISVIAPTKRNDQLLRPWTSIARCLAEQVIIFCKIT